MVRMGQAECIKNSLMPNNIPLNKKKMVYTSVVQYF